jgi:hypothetical protein
MSEDAWDPTSLESVISDDPHWYKAEPSPPLPDPMYDEYVCMFGLTISGTPHF